MSVDWNSMPPAFQLDPESRQNFIIAQVGQKFNGVVNVQTGLIFIHPCMVNVGNVVFQRNGSSIGLAQQVLGGGNGGGHWWVMKFVANVWHDAANDYAGFSIEKLHGEIKITVRSGLNKVCFTNPPPFEDDEHEPGRIMPGNWSNGLIDYLTANLPNPVVARGWSFRSLFKFSS